MNRQQVMPQPAFSFASTSHCASAFSETDLENAMKVAYYCQAAAIERCDAYVMSIPPQTFLESGSFGEREIYVIVSASEPDLEFGHQDDVNVAWVEFNLGHQVMHFTQETLQNALRVLRAVRASAPTLH